MNQQQMEDTGPDASLPNAGATVAAMPSAALGAPN